MKNSRLFDGIDLIKAPNLIFKISKVLWLKYFKAYVMID
jgi:hypothetical protein